MKYRTGILLALLTAIISGFAIFYNKLVVVNGIDSTIFNIIKNGGVGIILTALLFSTHKISQLPKLSKKQWLKLISIAAIGGSIPFVLFFEGLKNAPAINATIIQKSMFLWVAMLAISFLGEKIKWQHLVAFLLIAWSNLFIGGFNGFTRNTSELMILGATLFWSIEIIITKKTLSSVDNLIVSWARMTIGTIFLIGMALVEGKLALLTKITPQQLSMMLGSIMFLTVYVVSWHAALKKSPATIVTAVLILATPITNLLSALFLTHTFPPAQIVNALESLIGIAILLFIDSPNRINVIARSQRRSNPV
jgi:drug/metabolite transporter (DMT)-like permease